MHIRTATIVSLAALALTAGGAALSGCAESVSASAGHEEVERHQFDISLDAGHVHIFSEAELTFTVRDLEDCTDPEDASTCATVSGLPVVAFRRSPHGGSAREQELEQGVLVDNGDGSYTWTRSFNELGSHTVGLKFLEHDQMYFGAFPLSTSKAGSERLFCDTDGDGTDDHAFQIRWNASDGHIHPGSGEAVTFDIEVMRSFNQPIDTEQPWMNRFEHLSPSEATVTVDLMADTGGDATVLASPQTTYTGKGIYQVAHTFTEGELGGEHERTFWLSVIVEDQQGCVADGATHEEEFHFDVAAPH